MDASTYLAQRLASQHTAQFARENEIIRSQSERYAATGHPAPRGGFAVIVARLTKYPTLARRLITGHTRWNRFGVVRRPLTTGTAQGSRSS